MKYLNKHHHLIEGILTDFKVQWKRYYEVQHAKTVFLHFSNNLYHAKHPWIFTTNTWLCCIVMFLKYVMLCTFFGNVNNFLNNYFNTNWKLCIVELIICCFKLKGYNNKFSDLFALILSFLLFRWLVIKINFIFYSTQSQTNG